MNPFLDAPRTVLDLAGIRARQLEREDFARFDWIFAMEQANMRKLVEMRPRAGYPDRRTGATFPAPAS